MPSPQTGLIQTVLGAITPPELGPATTHEHLIIDFSFMFRPPAAQAAAMVDAPLTLENLGWIRHNHYSNRPNLELLDIDAAVAEAARYKSAGGGAIVDATTIGIGRSPQALAHIARQTGLRIIMGAGFYVDAVHPPDMDARSEDDLARQIIADITDGVDDSGIKAGIIGEIGCTWPLTANERKSLRASAIAQHQTGAAILIHPGRHPDAPLEILQTLSDAGADIARVIMGHLDRTVFDFDGIKRIAESGCYLEWDLFGSESSYYPLADIDMPSDAQRLDFVKRAVEDGYADKIVIAQDICTNHRLARYGGHGYAHILQNIVPRMRRKGFPEDAIQAIITHNPARILAFA